MSSGKFILPSVRPIFATLKTVLMNTSLAGIRNLLFDLGGVIINLDRQRCVDALTALGDEKADEMLDLSVQRGTLMDLEEGKISPSDFFKCMRQKIGKAVSDEEIVHALNELLIGIPLDRLTLLRKLRQRFNVMMLSNTNPIMFDTKIAECFAQEGLSITDYFDDVYLSYRLKSCKPDIAIFKKVIELSRIVPQETLFFDDSQKNLDAAASLGFKTFLVTPDRDIVTFFNTQSIDDF